VDKKKPTDSRTAGQADSSIPPYNFVVRGYKKVMIQVQVFGRQRQRQPDYNNTSPFFFNKKKVELKMELKN
jgi:hypothetical protein